MKKSKEELKTYFETGDKPTQQQYADLIDSYIDSKQPKGKPNRSFSIDENGDISVVPQLTNNELFSNFYEEISFTPRFYATQDDEYTVGTQTGKAIRMGNLVHFFIKMRKIKDPANINSSTGNNGAYITGLPFPNNNEGALYSNISTLNYFVATSIEEGVDIKNLSFTIANDNLLFVDITTSQRVTDIKFDGGPFSSDLSISGTYITNVYGTT